MSEIQPPVHTEVIPGSSIPVIERLVQTGLLSNFYLAGGTGLALMLGHRRSDAEDEPMPDMLAVMTWNTVKKYFLDEVPKLL